MIVAGVFAPGRCSNRTRCAEGDSAREGYVVAHNALKAHAKAVQLYRCVSVVCTRSDSARSGLHLEFCQYISNLNAHLDLSHAVELGLMSLLYVPLLLALLV